MKIREDPIPEAKKMRDVEAIYNRLLAQGYQDKLFDDLPKPKESKHGKETLAFCPFCEEDKKGHFSYNSQAPVWKCWKCGKGGDWIDYLRERRGLDFQEALRSLAKEAGVELEESPEARARHQAVVARATILEDAQAILGEWLEDPNDRAVWYFLRDRGYAMSDIRTMGLGAYTSRERLIAALRAKGHSEQAIKESGLLTPGFGETHKLTILWKDRAGRASGLVARAIMPVEPKYKYSYGLTKKEGMIGFSSARGAKSIIVVEGVLDAALLSARGLKVVATGGTDLSSEQLQAMEETGTEELILALDLDWPGQVATAKILRNLSGSSRLRLYVVSWPKEFKDPAELVLKKDVAAFREALNQAQRAARWYAGFMVSQHGKGARGLDMALGGAFEYFTGLDDGLLRRDFMDGLKEATGLAEEDLSQRLEAYEARVGQRRAEEALQRTHKRLQGAVEAGDIHEAEEALEDGLHALRTMRGAYEPEPYTLAGLLDDVAKMEAGLSTGYKSLDGMMSIPRGAITIISGRPQHGKTALMLNLLLNMAQSKTYQDKAFFFFSYEESRARLAIKSLMILSGVMLHQVQNREAFIHYIKEKRKEDPNRSIEEAIKTYGQLTESGRIWMMDQRPCAEDLAVLIGKLASRHDVGAIFCDYIQKVAVRRPGQAAYQDIKRASALLLDQAVKWDVPIIMGAQLSRAAQKELKAAEEEAKLSLDMLRESGDIEQDANLVLGLLNMDKLPPAPERAPGILQVQCMKYRDGASEWMKPLQFIGVTQKIKDPPAETAQKIKW